MSSTEPAPQTLGDRIRDRREAHDLSLKKFEKRICNLLPEPMWVSDEKLRRYETGQITEADADPFLVGVMATVLGCTVHDLSPLIADTYDILTALVADTVVRWYSDRGLLPGLAAAP